MNVIAPWPVSEAAASPQDDRRAGILDAARTCFSRSGFHRTSMQEICSEAKMSPGGLYRYFASKDAIIEAIAIEEQCVGRRVLEILLEPGTLGERLLKCGLAYITAMRDRRARQMLLEVWVESMRNSNVGEMFARCEEDNHALVRQVFDDAKAKGELPADADVDTIMLSLLAFADGIVVRMGLNPSFDVSRAEALLSRVVDAVLENRGADRVHPLETAG